MPDRITKALTRESPDFVAALKSMVAPSARPVGSKPLTGGEQLNKLKAAALKSQGGGQEQAPLRDAFLKELTDRRPRLSEISDALFSGYSRPVGDPGPSLGEMLEKSRAGRLNELATGYGIETKERSLDIKERSVSAAETQNRLEMLRKADKRAYDTFDGFVKNYNLSIEDSNKLFQAIDDDPREIGATGLNRVLHEKAQELGIKKSAKDSALQRRIDLLVETGVPYERAVGIATGRIVTSRDPISGQAQVIDKAQAGGGVAATGPAPKLPETSMSPDVDYSAGTGGSGFFGWALNTVTDMVGGKLLAPQVENASQGLTNLQIQTQTAMQSAVPGRPSNYLMEQLKRLSVDPANLLMGDERSYTRLRQTRDMLKSEIDRMDVDILAHPEWYRPQQIADTRANRSQLNRILDNYNVVVKSFEKALKKGGKQETVPRPSSKAEYDALPSGAQYVHPDGSTRIKK